MNLRRWIVALLLLLCTAVLHAESVSLADLARHDQYRDVKISPDGKYLAATAIVKGQTVLALIRLADKKGNVVSPREGNDVINFWWASPTRVVYTVGEHQGGYDSPLATGELFGVDADGGNPKLLYGYRNGGMSTGSHIQQAVADRGVGEFIASIPDDPNHVLVAISTWDAAGKEGFLPIVYRMDVRDGNLARILTAPMRNVGFIADHKGNVRFAYGEDVNGNEMDLGVAVFAGLRGRHFDDLAGAVLDADETVLPQGGTLHGVGGRGTGIGALKGVLMLRKWR